MSKLTRRLFLGSAPAAAFVAAPAAASQEEQTFDLLNWLDTAQPNSVAQYHAERLTEAMNKTDPDRSYSFHIDYDAGYCLVRNHGKSPSIARVYIDDGSPLLADDVTGTTAYADWEASRKAGGKS